MGNDIVSANELLELVCSNVTFISKVCLIRIRQNKHILKSDWKWVLVCYTNGDLSFFKFKFRRGLRKGNALWIPNEIKVLKLKINIAILSVKLIENKFRAKSNSFIKGSVKSRIIFIKTSTYKVEISREKSLEFKAIKSCCVMNNNKAWEIMIILYRQKGYLCTKLLNSNQVVIRILNFKTFLHLNKWTFYRNLPWVPY